MIEVRISDLLANPLVGDEQARVDATRVEGYANAFDEMPPVVVFETPEGLLLADGYHRVAAAQRAGRLTIHADIRLGSRGDALRYAAAQAAAERGITEAEALEAIIQRSARRWAEPP